jgi:colanic acid biosynthesis glycosyl transferase WcaI
MKNRESFRRPRIVFVNRFFFPDESATSQFTTDVAFELARDGYDVHVVTSRQVYQDPKRQLPRTETIDGVQVHRIWTSQRGRMHLWGLVLDYVTFYLSCAWHLLWILRRGSIVVARTDPPAVSVPVWIVARLRGAALVTWLADLFPEIATELGLPFGSGSLRELIRWVRNRSLKAAAANIVLADSMRSYITGEGIAPTTVRVIRDWAEGASIQPMPKRENPLAREWNLVDRFVIGYSGNMGRAHRFDAIIDAMTRLRERRDVCFLFIGDGIRKQQIAAAVEARGLENVVFQPYQSRARLGFSLTVPDIHLISLNPALEGFIVPSKFYSAAAAGRPTIYIGDSSGDIPTLVTRNNCGLVVGDGDVDGLTAAIERLIDDRDLYWTLATNARRTFERYFDRPVAMAAWQRLLEELRDSQGVAA